MTQESADRDHADRQASDQNRKPAVELTARGQPAGPKIENSTHAERASGASQGNDTDKDKPITVWPPLKYVRLEAIFAGCLMFLAAAQLISMNDQSAQMAKQSTEMTNQSRTADGQLRAMHVQNERMIDQLDLAKCQLQQAERALVEAAKATRATEDSAKAAQAATVLTRTSNEIATNTARLQLRPYITVVKTQLRYTTTGAEAIVTFQNSGQMFAHNVTAWASMACVIDGGKPQFEVKVPSTPRSVGPGAQFAQRLFWPLKNPTAEQVRRMQCWILGEIRYTDDFKGDRFTKFKYVQGPRLGEGYDFALEFAPDGNEAQ